jgi:hypothetical protein
MLFVPTLLALVGLVLCAVVATLVVRGALASMSAANWSERWLNASFITFAWHELGRGIFLGFVAAVGISPLTIAFFAGTTRFYSDVTFLSLLAWGAFAAGIFFVGVVTGLIGFLRYEAGNHDRHSLMNLAQLAIVGIAAFPVFIIFITFLVPSLGKVVGLWLDTMSLYAQLAS